MKKIVSIAAAAVLCCALTACGGSAKAPASSAAAAYSGTQTATANGMGELSVTITWENGKVTKCEADVANETPSIGGEAAPEICAAIVEKNSFDVDSISGATITSDAIKKAAEECFKAAGI